MVASNSPSSSATRSAELAGASLGALLPLAGLPALAWALEEPPAEALLEEDALLEALLDEALLEELLELEEEAVCSSSEKSISSGGSPSLLVEGSGGIRLSSGRWSDSLYTGVERSPLRELSGPLSLAERLRCDSSPLREAVLWLDSLPDSMLGRSMLGRLLETVTPGIPWLGLLDELLEGMPALAVEDWLLLEELLDEEELDWDCDEELEDDWD
ncbi:hypothetical protein [Microbulbifer sp.]|uniref:hypothetical protein n=1 Tax=Microbulbifer sp. TaxID=1908541 RepID=UPI003F341005